MEKFSLRWNNNNNKHFATTKSETAEPAPSPSKETKQQPRWLLINSGLCMLALDLPMGPMTTSLTHRVLIPSEN
jgi:hypothetical protein